MRRTFTVAALVAALTVGALLDAQVLAGAALTTAGLAFAVTARQRRRRLETAPAS